MNDLSTVRYRAEQARNVLEEPIFKQAIACLKDRWLAEAVSEGVTKERRDELLDLTRALLAIPSHLESAITDLKQALRRHA